MYWSKYVPRGYSFRREDARGNMIEVRSPADCNFTELPQWPQDDVLELGLAELKHIADAEPWEDTKL